MRALRIAPVLLSLAACFTSTADLAPKTQAQCAAELGVAAKACGNRCVTTLDPATGCAEAGCHPCPSGPAGEPATCGAGGACSHASAAPTDPDPTGTVDPTPPGTLDPTPPGTLDPEPPSTTVPACAPPAAMCGGACVSVLTDTSHCGACDHVCGSGETCSGGLCSAALVTQGTATISPRSLVCREYGWLAFLDASSRAWMHGSMSSTDNYWRFVGYEGPYGPTARMAAQDQGGAPYVYVTGRVDGGTHGAVHEYVSALGFVDPIVTTATDTFSGLDVTDRWAYYTKADDASSSISWVERWWWDDSAHHSSDPRLAGSVDLTGTHPELAPFSAVATTWDSGTGAWHVFALGGKVIAHLREVATEKVEQAPIVLPAPADRLAATSTSAGVLLYVADSATGRVWRVEPGGAVRLLAGPSAAAPGHLELIADPHGAYWTDAAAHAVMEYREADGVVFALAGPTTARQPWGLCRGPWSGYLSWSDANDDVVRGVPR